MAKLTYLLSFVLLFAMIFLIGNVSFAVLNPSDPIYSSEIKAGNVWFFFNDTNRKVKVQLKNTGNITWTDEKQFHLSYHLLDGQGNVVLFDGLRTHLPKDVAPGESVKVTAEIQSPQTAGSYQIQWDMVQENVTWFSERSPSSSITNELHVTNYYQFMATVLLIIAALMVVLIIFARKKIITIPKYIKEPAKVIWSKADIILFVAAMYWKISYFSNLTNIALTENAKTVSFLAILFIGIMFNLMKFGNKRMVLLACINLLLTTLMLSDMVYLNYFDSVLSVPVLLYMSQTASVKGSIK
ncbi:NBR1-Ig-like domain-containing protein, partial [Paenibacillus sp. NPDC056579]|uniref:NBR1-Ig-like domain-containing protein n=1 Tax=Paenibacillus sp. NPDC056579 TaxID=3345871 RepID=UPI00369D87C5